MPASILNVKMDSMPKEKKKGKKEIDDGKRVGHSTTPQCAVMQKGRRQAFKSRVIRGTDYRPSMPAPCWNSEEKLPSKHRGLRADVTDETASSKDSI